MKLKENINLTEFFTQINTCNASVTFVSSEGDSLDLKSIFCQYIFAPLYMKNNACETGEIHCEDAEDYKRLKDYIEQTP